MSGEYCNRFPMAVGTSINMNCFREQLFLYSLHAQFPYKILTAAKKGL